ncbi:MAG TPA: radical SAM protein, partial [Bacillota bacterium]|nr:radical SAM protein [Bacillota bacterium]
NPLTLEAAVEISKKLLILFEGNGVKVIRTGLQPTDNINSGKDVVAGPFHPAFRQLVESLIYREMLAFMIGKSEKKYKTITVKANPRNISELAGHKKSNLSYIKSRFFIDKFVVLQDLSVEADSIVLSAGEDSIIMSKKYYYSISYK